MKCELIRWKYQLTLHLIHTDLILDFKIIFRKIFSFNLKKYILDHDAGHHDAAHHDAGHHAAADGHDHAAHHGKLNKFWKQINDCKLQWSTTLNLYFFAHCYHFYFVLFISHRLKSWLQKLRLVSNWIKSTWSLNDIPVLHHISLCTTGINC